MTPLERHASLLRSNGWLFLALPNLVSWFAFFADNRRGILVGSLFLLPLLAFAPVYLRLRNPRNYRESISAGIMLAMPALVALAFILLSVAHLNPAGQMFWRIIVLQVLILLAGILAGLIKHDPEALADNIRSRFKVSPGKITIQKRPAAIYGFRQKTGSFVFDWGAKIIYAAYATIILAMMLLGGGAPFVILNFMGGLDFVAESVGIHVLAIIGVGMLTLPFIGYILPALYRYWRDVRSIECQASRESDDLIYDWIET